ncbi:MAG: DNA ligase D, partial [Hyphomicrobiales bacterium]|nr:DNA ligase D [Hyphomicrobiales bacterium]
DGLTTRFPKSVATERAREDIESGKRGGAAAARKAAALPAFVAPALCGQADAPPEGREWLYEMKYDGYRLQIATNGVETKIYTRSGLDWTRKFPAIAADARALKCASALIDGEAVVLAKSGLSDFPALVAALEQKRPGAIALMAFDLLALDGKSLRKLPLTERKRRLKALIGDGLPNLRFADHLETGGADFFRQVVEAGAEGVIAKKRDSAYVSGRSSAWLKIKGYPRTDVIVVGWQPSKKNELFASLHAAVEEGDELRYVGGVGTGFSAAQKSAIFARLARDETAKPPANLTGDPPRGVKFIRRPLRAEIRFGGWTGDGHLRQARFLALRDDLPMKKTTRRAAAETAPAPQAPVIITHPDRIVFPDDGVTKGEIAAYYEKVADRILPHLSHRPVSILRAPENISETFFQRHPLKGMNKGVLGVGDEAEPYMALDGKTGLMTAAQFGAIELHGWMSTTDSLDHPDRMVFDLDPDESLDFADVKKAARDIADHLEDIGLKSWPMISGGKGIHIVAPLDRSLAYADTEIFAKGFAEGLASKDGQRFVATMSKARRKGRIFVDWLRNKKTATAILPWSLRARKGASVAVPLTWRNLAKTKSAAAFSISTALGQNDPWDDFWNTKQSIPAAAIDFMRSQSMRK